MYLIKAILLGAFANQVIAYSKQKIMAGIIRDNKSLGVLSEYKRLM